MIPKLKVCTTAKFKYAALQNMKPFSQTDSHFADFKVFPNRKNMK